MVKLIDWRIRMAALRGLIDGSSSIEVAKQLHVGQVTVLRWANIAGMKMHKGRNGGIVLPCERHAPDRVERRYGRLTFEQRVLIATGRTSDEPLSIRAIARMLGVSASTISRELTAHSQSIHGIRRYDAVVAHHRAMSRRDRGRPGKLEHPELRQEVVARLDNRFSPEQTAADLKTSFPDRPEMHVSHETIYQALYVQGKGSLRDELRATKALRSGRSTRKPRSKLPARGKRPWLDGARLSDRPAQVEDRAVPGHWEGDLVVGPDNSGIVTLAERATRFTLIGRLPGVRDSETVIDVMKGMVAGLPGELLRTLTWDQGPEMALHEKFTVATNCKVYFCDPHSPWQRGTNENTNGLIRDFYPKGTDFNTISDAELLETQRLLNIRPRKTLGWKTPGDTLSELINGVALAG